HGRCWPRHGKTSPTIGTSATSPRRSNSIRCWPVPLSRRWPCSARRVEKGAGRTEKETNHEQHDLSSASCSLLPAPSTGRAGVAVSPMHDYWGEFLKVALAHLLAVASPGPDLAIVIKQSLRHGRRTAIWTAIGVGAAILLHVTYSLLGLGLL